MDAVKIYDIATEINEIEDGIAELREKGVDILVESNGCFNRRNINNYLSDEQIEDVKGHVICYLKEAADDLRKEMKQIIEAGNGNT